MRRLPTAARVYVLGVVAAAVVVATWAAWTVLQAPHARPEAILALAMAYAVADGFYARSDEGSPRVGLGSVITIAAIPVVGAAGAVLVASASLVSRDGSPPTKRMFNTAQAALSAGAAGAAYHALGGEIRLNRASFPEVLGQILAADIVHCTVNGMLVASVVSLVQRIPLRSVVQGAMAGSAPSYLAYGLYGLLLAVLWDGAHVGPLSALLVLLPLVVARWAYRQYVAEQEAYDRTIRTLVAAVETKDHYTRGHSERVALASTMIAGVLGMRENRARTLRYAGVLHDVGKLGVPTRVLQKNGRLDDDEYEAVKVHPVRGLEMVREIGFLEEAFVGILHHHERMDGRGYPMGLRGPDIPEFARLIAVADAFDAMTSTRSYRRPRTIEEAIAELRRCTGTQFDPQMVDALVAAVADAGWQTEQPPPPAGAEEPPVSRAAEEPRASRAFRDPQARRAQERAP